MCLVVLSVAAVLGKILFMTFILAFVSVVVFVLSIIKGRYRTVSSVLLVVAVILSILGLTVQCDPRMGPPTTCRFGGDFECNVGVEGREDASEVQLVITNRYDNPITVQSLNYTLVEPTSDQQNNWNVALEEPIRLEPQDRTTISFVIEDWPRQTLENLICDKGPVQGFEMIIGYTEDKYEVYRTANGFVTGRFSP